MVDELEALRGELGMLEVISETPAAGTKQSPDAIRARIAEIDERKARLEGEIAGFAGTDVKTPSPQKDKYDRLVREHLNLISERFLLKDQLDTDNIFLVEQVFLQLIRGRKLWQTNYYRNYPLRYHC